MISLALAILLVSVEGQADTVSAVTELVREAQEEVDRGWGAADRARRIEHFRIAESHARDAHEIAPTDPEARWWLVVALGLRAQESSLLQRIGLVRELRAEAESLLEDAPDHPGGHHAMGRLHAAVMRLDPVSRALTTLLAGGGELDAASWDAAESHLRRARELEPGAPHHSVELARILRDRGRLDEAYREAERARSAPAGTPLAHWYRGWAAELLEELGPKARSPQQE
jgi:tetratricopeptide (TPR) repeat protein